MKCFIGFLILTFLFDTSVFSQDSIPTTDSASIQVAADNLLPTHYLPTQHLLWGEKGLMRHLDSFKLSEESRERELDIRDKMFTAHRYLGYATLVGMIAQGIVGERLYQGHNGLKGLHEGLAGVVNIGYFTSASMALFAPPRAKDRAPGFSTVKLHKYLSIVHLSSMIATNILSGMTESNPNFKALHRATAYTAFGSFFASIVVIRL
jgi:hypothetical protein